MEKKELILDLFSEKIVFKTPKEILPLLYSIYLIIL